MVHGHSPRMARGCKGGPRPKSCPHPDCSRLLSRRTRREIDAGRDNSQLVAVKGAGADFPVHRRTMEPVAELSGPRRGEKIDLAPHEAERSKARSQVERTNSQLKDHHGGRQVRVRGPTKVYTHLMFGIPAIAGERILRLLTEPPRSPGPAADAIRRDRPFAWKLDLAMSPEWNRTSRPLKGARNTDPRHLPRFGSILTGNFRWAPSVGGYFRQAFVPPSDGIGASCRAQASGVLDR